MTEDQLRQIVREALARHLGTPQEFEHDAGRPEWTTHPSHLRLKMPAGRDGDGLCLIEPAVRCTHCGYCQSWGH